MTGRERLPEDAAVGTVVRMTWEPGGPTGELPSWAIPDDELVHPHEDHLIQFRYMRNVPKVPGEHRWLRHDVVDPRTGEVVTSSTCCFDCQSVQGWDDAEPCDRPADDGWYSERVAAHNRAHGTGLYQPDGLSMRRRTRQLQAKAGGER